MKLNFLNLLREKFSIKLFIIVTIFLLIISSSFTVFFYYQQSKSLKNTLIKNSELLVGILAYSVRLGVFSENKDLLKDTVEGILQQENILEVSVFNLQKKLLKRLKKYEIRDPKTSAQEDEKTPSNIVERLRQGQPLFYLEGKESIELWSPVITGAGYASEEYLMLGENPLKKREVIGFVKITVDKTGLKKRLNSLLLKSILIVLVFWVIGSLLTFVMAKQITTPLKRLTEGVYTLGIRGVAKEVTVETDDEIGKLAQAFNNMLGALRKREGEKEQLEEQLRHAQKMEAIGTLTGGIAHDFNNILTAIIGFGNLLQFQLDKNDPSRVYIDQIISSAHRAATLTQSLLAFSRKQLLNPRAINLNDCIGSIKKILARLIREDIEFKVNLTQDELIVMADSGQIDQVFMNLVTNARDAMPKGGSLTITTELVNLDGALIKTTGNTVSGRYALFTVIDTGIGMDERVRERIFDPFFTTKEVGRGTGLGLSMIYGIIKQHGGYIDVISQVGKGSTFRIYLPLIELKVAKEEEKARRLPKGGTETVLLAEDDPTVRMLSKEVLERFGYKVIEAIDGEEAVEKFRENGDKIELLLFDIIMPKKNGKEAYGEIKKIRPDIKALFISGYASDVISKKEITEEGINMISKPVSPEELLRKVREVLDFNRAKPS